MVPVVNVVGQPLLVCYLVSTSRVVYGFQLFERRVSCGSDHWPN